MTSDPSEVGLVAPVRQVVSEVSLDGDEANGLDDLYRSHSAWLRRVVGRKGNVDQADDVVQDTFIRAAKYTGSERIRHPRALLWKIAQNIIRSGGRAAITARRASPDLPVAAVELAVGADQFQALVLKETVLALPEIYRDVFLLSRFGGMSYDQIAEARGISIKTVEWRMSRALAMCAARMRE